jgi:hypothetical protein
MSTVLLLAGGAAAADERDFAVPAILSLRAQAELRDAWLAKRLETLVPALMRREGVDLWLIVAREQVEDPVARTMLPSTWLSARRRTVLMFYDPGDGHAVEKLAVSRYAVGDAFPAAWVPEQDPDQWHRIAQLVRERNPKRIAVDRSADFPLADGLTASEAQALEAALGADLAARLVPGEKLALGWLETRIDAEMEVYPSIERIANAIIAEGLSEQVITPGVTTTEDVVWWYRERIRGLGLGTWFQPSVDIQRAGAEVRSVAALVTTRHEGEVIQPGDLLHVDFGISYLGLNTDTQNMAYVLRPGEHDAPAGLRAGLAAANRLQDILVANFRKGESGNALLARARREALAAGITPSIYSHPTGYHGHGAGAAIGMWDNQGHVPAGGDYPVQPDTVWSIELNAEQAVPEWGGKTVRFMLEENAYFDGTKVRFIDGRQTRFHLVPRP